MNKVIHNSKAVLLAVMCLGAIGASSVNAQANAQTKTTPADVAAMSDAQYDRMYADMDTNKDGMISRAEYLAYQGMNYDRMDGSKKGSLSRQEMRDRMFQREINKTDGNPMGNTSAPGAVQRK
jgi:hypothetical protein